MSDLPFGFDQPEDSPGFLLWQTTMLWQRQIRKALEAHDVSHAQFVIMATLLWFRTHGYSSTQVQIVNWTKLDKMTVSKALKGLSSKKLIRRTEDRKDSRAKQVTLTEAGKNLVCTLVPIVESIDGTFFGRLTANEQQRVVHILGKLSEET